MVLEILGGLGSDVFNVGGNNGQPIDVVANSLDGHSGLIDNWAYSSDPNYTGIFVQDVSANVGDNDEAGVVVSPGQRPLRVFEDASPTGLVSFEYYVVLTRAPEETVRVTAAPVPGRESEYRAGGRGIALNGSETGVTLLFDRTNWSMPQKVTITALSDTLAEGTRVITIQHSVVQGASPDDGGAYDGLVVLGAWSRSSTTTPRTSRSCRSARAATPTAARWSSEDVPVGTTGGLAYKDAYQVLLAHAPAPARRSRSRHRSATARPS